jgi:hypothetical protein
MVRRKRLIVTIRPTLSVFLKCMDSSKVNVNCYVPEIERNVILAVVSQNTQSIQNCSIAIVFIHSDEESNKYETQYRLNYVILSEKDGKVKILYKYV